LRVRPSRRELPSQKALLRLQLYHDEVPSANGGNAAVHLTNFALHAVAARSSRLTDPRMRSLKSVGHLQVRTNRGLPSYFPECLISGLFQMSAACGARPVGCRNCITCSLPLVICTGMCRPLECVKGLAD
jgi:hypothetical protein